MAAGATREPSGGGAGDGKPGGLGLAVSPFDDEPQGLALVELAPVLRARRDATDREASSQLAPRAHPPGAALEFPLALELARELRQLNTVATVDRLPDFENRGRWVDADGILEAYAVQFQPELGGCTVRAVGQDETTRESCGERAPHHL